MKHIIEGIGKIEIINSVLFINDQTLSQIFENSDMDNMSLLGSIRIEIYGKEPCITVKGGERA